MLNPSELCQRLQSVRWHHRSEATTTKKMAASWVQPPCQRNTTFGHNTTTQPKSAIEYIKFWHDTVIRQIKPISSAIYSRISFHNGPFVWVKCDANQRYQHGFIPIGRHIGNMSHRPTLLQQKLTKSRNPMLEVLQLRHICSQPQAHKIYIRFKGELQSNLQCVYWTFLPCARWVFTNLRHLGVDWRAWAPASLEYYRQQTRRSLLG